MDIDRRACGFRFNTIAFWVKSGQSRYSYKDTCVSETRYLARIAGDSSQYPCACRMIREEDGSAFKLPPSGAYIIDFRRQFFIKLIAHSAAASERRSPNFTNRPTFTIAHIAAYSLCEAPSKILNFLKNRRKSPKVIVWVFVSRAFLFKIV